MAPILEAFCLTVFTIFTNWGRPIVDNIMISTKRQSWDLNLQI